MLDHLTERNSLTIIAQIMSTSRGFSVKSSLNDLSCRDTPSGRLSYLPIVPGLTDTMNCSEYRATVMERAGADPTEADLGAIWLDDMVGENMYFNLIFSRPIIN